MKNCILFLPGRYYTTHLDFYRKLCRGRFKIAVDGGYRFFAASGLHPDLLLGDFDSLGSLPPRLPARTEVLSFPTDKDKTDTHLALEYCLSRRAKHIDIVQPTTGDVDHFTSNLMLLSHGSVPAGGKYRPEIRLVNPRYEIRYLKNCSHVLDQARGDVVSVIPLSSSIGLSCSGTAFDVTRLRVPRGKTVTTRNKIVAARAVFKVAGEALLFHLHKRRWRQDAPWRRIRDAGR